MWGIDNVLRVLNERRVEAFGNEPVAVSLFSTAGKDLPARIAQIVRGGVTDAGRASGDQD